MIRSTEEILALSGEAAVAMEEGRAVYANAPARALLGKDVVGRSAEELIGASLPLGGQPFVYGELRLNGAPYAARLGRVGEEQLEVLFLTPCAAEPPILNEAFLVALRSELTGIAIVRENLADCPDTPREELRRLLRSEKRLQRLTENASLVFNRGCSGVPFHPRERDLRFLCASVMAAVACHFPGIRFLWTTGEPLVAPADADLVIQMLLNVIANAIQHAKGLSCISLDVRDLPTRVVISVRDDGSGIAPEQIPALFERYRYPYAVSELGRGAGLGMSAVRAVVDLHGGALLVESRLGMGTNVQMAIGKDCAPKPQPKAAGNPGLGAEEELRACTMADLQLGLSVCLDESNYDELWND